MELLFPMQSTKIYVISFPKVGRTWLKMLICKYLCEVNNLPEKLMLKFRTWNITKRCNLPRTVFRHDFSSNPIKHYKSLSSNKSFYSQHKVVLLTRDIKDTLVSCYFEFTNRTGRYKGSISEFIRDDYYGARKFLIFYKYWYESKHVPKDFLLIDYEELYEDAGKVLYDVLKFIGVDSIEQETLQRAVNFSSFDNLRSMEETGLFDSERLSPGDIDDPESFKFRKGKVGGYKEYLSREDIEYIDNLVGEVGKGYGSTS